MTQMQNLYNTGLVNTAKAYSGFIDDFSDSVGNEDSKEVITLGDVITKLDDALYSDTLNIVNLMHDKIFGYTLENLDTYKDGWKNILKEYQSGGMTEIVDDVLKAHDSDIYKYWNDYATNSSITILDAVNSAISSTVDTKRKFSLIGLSDTQLLQKEQEFKESDFEALATTVGIDAATLTVQTFQSAYDEAIKNDFTNETIEKWNNLGTALLDLTEAQSEYAEALKEQQTVYEDFINSSNKALQNSLTTNFNSFITNLNTIGATVLNLGTSTQNAISSITNSNLNETDSIVAFNQLRGEVDGYFNGTSNLTSSELSTKYNSLLSFASNLSNSNTALQPEILNYLESNLGNFESQEEILKVSIVEGLGDLLSLNELQVSQLKLSVADGVITNSELSSISGLTAEQKDGIVTVANNSNYFSTEETLNSLQILAQEELKALKLANESEAENLSTKTLQYGDFIGLQEQIDIAKLFETPYENVKDFISQVQGISLLNDGTKVYDAYSNIVGLNSETFTYDVSKASMLEKLSQYISVPGVDTNVTGAIDYWHGQQKNLEFASNIETYASELLPSITAFTKEKQESDNAKTAYDNYFSQALYSKYGSYKNVEEDFYNDKVHYHEGYSYNTRYQNPHTAYFNPYQKEFDEAQTALSEVYKQFETFINDSYFEGIDSSNYKNIAGEIAGDNTKLLEKLDQLIQINIEQAKVIQKLENSNDEMNTRDKIKSIKDAS